MTIENQLLFSVMFFGFPELKVSRKLPWQAAYLSLYATVPLASHNEEAATEKSGQSFAQKA